MKCVICKIGETEPGKTTVTLERDNLTIVIKEVPAQVCMNCGEDYVDDTVAGELLAIAEQIAKTGSQVDIMRYVPGMKIPC